MKVDLSANKRKKIVGVDYKNEKCSICGKQYTSKGYLMTHMKNANNHGKRQQSSDIKSGESDSLMEEAS